MESAARVHPRRRERGYNLIEVLVAMALLGTVLISIVTLFFMGRRNVYSGKQMTQAVAVANTVSEDLSSMTMDDFVTFFGLGATSLGTVTVAGESYPASRLVTTNPMSADPEGYLTKWSELLTTQDFADAKLSMIVTPYHPTTAATWANAPILRIRTVIEWQESTRPRHFELNTVKTNRTRL